MAIALNVEDNVEMNAVSTLWAVSMVALPTKHHIGLLLMDAHFITERPINDLQVIFFNIEFKSLI